MAGDHSGSRLCAEVALTESGESSLPHHPQNCWTAALTVPLPGCAMPAEPQLSEQEKGSSLFTKEPRSCPPTLPGRHTEAHLVPAPHFEGNANPKKVQPMASLALGQPGLAAAGATAVPATSVQEEG